jgi:hypothetical protein
VAWPGSDDFERGSLCAAVGTRNGPAASSERERFWRKLVAGQSQFGVSIREWCDRHGVSEPSFYFWRQEQRQNAMP